MIDRLEYARVYADSDYDGKKQGQRFALLAIANAVIAVAERMDEAAKRQRHESKAQIGETGKREMNILEVKTMKSGEHKNLRWVNGTRWLVWSKKEDVWIVYDRKRNQQKQRLVTTEEEAEAIKWLLYQNQEDDCEDKVLVDSFLDELIEAKKLFLSELADSSILFLKEMRELASEIFPEAKTNDR